ncbi:MAG: GNAT family N-acetyltransferase [Chloroflexota bacterium]|jgi:GNAT superfamily N-acetyltransferase
MTISSTPATLPTLRNSARELLNEFDAADGLAAYYALHHPPRRTTLILHRDSNADVDGFLVRCQTGIDLFRPLVTLRSRGPNAIPELIEEGMLPQRPYLIVVPASQVERLEPFLEITQETTNRILRLDPDRFRLAMNVLVVRSQDADGNPKVEMRSGDRVVASAGVNWRSPIFAEVYVRVDPQYRGRGRGRAVVNALAGDLLKEGVTPLYNVVEGNEASLELALQVGFVDTSAREVMAHAARL